MDINTFSKLTYGVHIVSSGDKNKKNAFIATAVFQVTAVPERIAIASNVDNYTTKIIRDKKAVSVSVLKQDSSSSTMSNFGFRTGKDVDKFEKCNYITGEKTGVPIVLDDAIAWFECEVEQEINLGTHILFICRVVDCKTLFEQDIPLTYKYYHEVKRGIIHKNAPSYVNKEKTINVNEKNMVTMKYVCTVCGYVYDPETGDPDSGIAPGTAFENLPDDWACPICGVSKDQFEQE